MDTLLMDTTDSTVTATIRYLRTGPEGFPPACEYVTEETDFERVKENFDRTWGLAGYRIVAWRLTATDDPSPATSVADLPWLDQVLRYFGYQVATD